MTTKEDLLGERYRLVPQLRAYDNIRQQILPYMCQSNPPNLLTKPIETDDLGYRVSYFQSQRVDSKTWFNFPRKGMILGGSVAMGWGSSSDRTSLSSQLSERLGFPIGTLGIMAGNSLMEFIAAVPFYAQADLVISVTGNNTLYSCVAAGKTSFDLYGPMMPFNNMVYEQLRNLDILTLAYLINDKVRPEQYFKSKEQRKLFRQNMRSRAIRRVKAWLFGEMDDPVHGSKERTIEEILEFAVNMQTRDILNIHNTCRPGAYICVLQPFLPSLKKALSPEEERLREIQNKLSRPDLFEAMYSTMGGIYSEFIKRCGAFCRRNQIPYIDAHHTDYTGWAFVDSSHFSDSGNAQLVRQVHEYLEPSDGLKHRQSL